MMILLAASCYREGLYRSQTGVSNEEKRGADNLLKSADITVNIDRIIPFSENAISKDIYLIMEQDFAVAFQTLRQQAKDIQQQMAGNSGILSRLKQKLNSHM